LPHPAVSPADALAALRAPGDGGLVARSSSSTSMAALQQQQQQQEATPRFHLHTPATPRSPRLLLNVRARELLRASAITVPAVAELLPDSLDVISQHASPIIPARDDSNHRGGPHSMGWIERADGSAWRAAGAYVIPFFAEAFVSDASSDSSKGSPRPKLLRAPVPEGAGHSDASHFRRPMIAEAVSVCIWFRTGTWGTSTAAGAATAAASIVSAALTRRNC
jgi:hypothetical protein